MGEFSLFCENDSDFFKDIAKDLGEWSGATTGEKGPNGETIYAANYYARDKSANFDPTYMEVDLTKPPVYRGAYNLPLPIEFEESKGHYNQMAEDEGVDREYDAIAWIDVLNWDEHVLGESVTVPGFKEPAEGDVIALFEGKDSERWYDVQKVERFGYTLTSDKYTGWRLTLMNRASLEADRRLETQNS